MGKNMKRQKPDRICLVMLLNLFFIFWSGLDKVVVQCHANQVNDAMPMPFFYPCCVVMRLNPRMLVALDVSCDFGSLFIILVTLLVDDVEESQLVDTVAGRHDTKPITELLLLEELLGPIVFFCYQPSSRFLFSSLVGMCRV